MNSALTPIENHLKKATEMTQREFAKSKGYYRDAVMQLERIADMCVSLGEKIREQVKLNRSRESSSATTQIVTPPTSESGLEKTNKLLSQIVFLLSQNCILPQNLCEQVQVDEDIAYLSDIKSNFVVPNIAKQIIHTYARILSGSATNKTSNTVIDTCFSLVWKWFNARFLQKHPDFSHIKYNVNNIPDMIYAIIIHAGYALTNGEFSEFVEEFSAWIDMIGKDQTITSKYLLPYETASIYSGLQSEYANVAAMLIWRLMMRFGYSAFETIAIAEGKVAVLTEDGLYQKVSALNDGVLDTFAEVKDNPDCYSQYNII